MKGGEIFVISALLLSLMAGAASAQNCGPTVSLNTNYTDGFSNSSGSNNNANSYMSGNISNSNMTSGANSNASDNENISLGMTISWQIGAKKMCEQQASARLHQQKLQNLEQTLRLCKTYGNEHPLLQGKCY